MEVKVDTAHLTSVWDAPLLWKVAGRTAVNCCGSCRPGRPQDCTKLFPYWWHTVSLDDSIPGNFVMSTPQRDLLCPQTEPCGRASISEQLYHPVESMNLSGCNNCGRQWIWYKLSIAQQLLPICSRSKRKTDVSRVTFLNECVWELRNSLGG